MLQLRNFCYFAMKHEKKGFIAYISLLFRDIYNNVTLSLFSRENACSKETTGFILTNMFSENIEYSLIVQRMDGKKQLIYSSIDITAVIQMNSEIHGSIQGFTTDSFLSYRIYVWSNAPSKIDFQCRVNDG